MGQYYKPVVLTEDKKAVLKSVECYTFNNGAKLMEHSYLDNNFVNAFASLIDEDINGEFCGQPVAWCGDYAEDDECNGKCYYNLVCDVEEQNPSINLSPSEVPDGYSMPRFIVNKTQKTFVDTTKCKDDDGWTINPLPLLTCIGNGRGGGDFRGENDFVGNWATDVVVVTSKKPSDDFAEIEPNFHE